MSSMFHDDPERKDQVSRQEAPSVRTKYHHELQITAQASRATMFFEQYEELGNTSARLRMKSLRYVSISMGSVGDTASVRDAESVSYGLSDQDILYNKLEEAFAPWLTQSEPCFQVLFAVNTQVCITPFPVLENAGMLQRSSKLAICAEMQDAVAYP
jgi:hypothetical protein